MDVEKGMGVEEEMNVVEETDEGEEGMDRMEMGRGRGRGGNWSGLNGHEEEQQDESGG